MSHRIFAGVGLLALLSTGCLVRAAPGISYPEGDPLAIAVLRDGPVAEELDAKVLWSVVHPDIRAQNSRSEFIGCFFASAARSAPSEPASGIDFDRSLWGVAFYRGEVPSDNVLVKDGNTYSIVDRRVDRRIAAFDVQVEGPQETSVKTFLLSEGAADGDGPTSYLVGTEPPEPCLVGAEAVREHLQATAMITIGHYRGELPELNEYQVVAVLWDGEPDELDLVGGTFWNIDDGGNGGGVVHPPNEGDVDGAGYDEDDLQIGDPDQPDVLDEPPQPGEWVGREFSSARTAQIEPGTYIIEIWANPIELTPSATAGVPADGAERNCVIEVDITAGTHLDVFIDDIPTGGECPHDAKFRAPLVAP